MDFAAAAAWLDALALYGVKAGLEHTRATARRMGEPQSRFPALLVAGTNGKGSTCAVLDAALRAAGLRTGFYSSPHLVDVRERIRVAGEPVAPEAFAAALTRVREAAGEADRAGELEGPPTFFEALTLAAFDLFGSAGLDLAVVEVGLGGRLDCTNVLEPRLTVVTSIALDHQEYLGEGVESIAREKAGIFRAGVPALCGAAEPAARAVLEAEAARVGAPFLSMEACAVTRREGGWRLNCPEGTLDLPEPALPGEHQFANAALAVRAGLLLRGMGWPLPDEALRAGVASARWLGRLQRVLESPQTWLDGAHNPDGCLALARFAQGLPRPRMLVFTCMRDKDPGPMAAALFGAFDAVWVTGLPMARCAEPALLAQRCGFPGARVEPDAAEAVRQARAAAGPSGSVTAAGSLYLVGHLLAKLGGEKPTLYGTGL